jgi:hypothetical protein
MGGGIIRFPSLSSIPAALTISPCPDVFAIATCDPLLIEFRHEIPELFNGSHIRTRKGPGIKYSKMNRLLFLSKCFWKIFPETVLAKIRGASIPVDKYPGTSSFSGWSRISPNRVVPGILPTTAIYGTWKRRSDPIGFDRDNSCYCCITKDIRGNDREAASRNAMVPLGGAK